MNSQLLHVFKIILRIVLLHIFVVSNQVAVWRLFFYLVNENLNAVQMKYILYFLDHVKNQNKQTHKTFLLKVAVQSCWFFKEANVPVFFWEVVYSTWNKGNI